MEVVKLEDANKLAKDYYNKFYENEKFIYKYELILYVLGVIAAISSTLLIINDAGLFNDSFKENICWKIFLVSIIGYIVNITLLFRFIYINKQKYSTQEKSEYIYQKLKENCLYREESIEFLIQRFNLFQAESIDKFWIKLIHPIIDATKVIFPILISALLKYTDSFPKSYKTALELKTAIYFIIVFAVAAYIIYAVYIINNALINIVNDIYSYQSSLKELNKYLSVCLTNIKIQNQLNVSNPTKSKKVLINKRKRLYLYYKIKYCKNRWCSNQRQLT